MSYVRISLLRRCNRPELPWAFHLESYSQCVEMYLCAFSMYLAVMYCVHIAFYQCCMHTVPVACMLEDPKIRSQISRIAFTKCAYATPSVCMQL